MLHTSRAFIAAEKKHFSRFFVVGIFGTVIDVGLLALFKHWGWQTVPASVCSFAAGALHNYLWHRYWTFQHASKAQIHRQLTQFLLVSFSNILLSALLLWALEPLFAQLLSPWHQEPLAYLPTKIIALAVIMGWSFTVNRFWTFKPLV